MDDLTIADRPLDLMVLVCVVALCMPILTSSILCSTRLMTKSLIYNDDKSALHTTQEIDPQEPELTRDDLLLMCVVADRYALTPRTLKFGGKTITMNTAFMADKSKALADVVQVFPTRQPLIMELEVTPDGLQAWAFKHR